MSNLRAQQCNPMKFVRAERAMQSVGYKRPTGVCTLYCVIQALRFVLSFGILYGEMHHG